LCDEEDYHGPRHSECSLASRFPRLFITVPPFSPPLSGAYRGPNLEAASMAALQYPYPGLALVPSIRDSLAPSKRTFPPNEPRSASLFSKTIIFRNPTQQMATPHLAPPFHFSVHTNYVYHEGSAQPQSSSPCSKPRRNSSCPPLFGTTPLFTAQRLKPFLPRTALLDKIPESRLGFEQRTTSARDRLFFPES